MEPRRFQQATISAAMDVLGSGSGPRRFLVADEVGLGKTVVARGVVQHMMESRSRQLTVFYVANGQAVAHQNRDRLIDFLPTAARKKAVSKADRLGLIPLTDPPQGRVGIFSLTPATSFPGTRTRLSGGRKEERAFIAALLRRALPRLLPRIDPDTLRGSAGKEGWALLVDAKQREAGDAPLRLVAAFRMAVEREFGRPVRDMIIASSDNESKGAFAGRLRRALAEAALIARPPDLIIFDEFQRYRTLLSEAGQADRLVQTLLQGRRSRPPAILLLSATPYRQYVSRWEESRGIAAQAELFQLIEFLGGRDGAHVRQEAELAFKAFGDTIRALALAPPNSPGLPALEAEARRARKHVHALLACLMARTERRPTNSDLDGTCLLEPAVTTGDVRAYRHLVDSFLKTDRGDAIAFWASIPLPAQAMGNRYQASRRAKFRRDPKLVALTRDLRDEIKAPPAWPSPKLRQLRELAKPTDLALPWCSPSQPWWPLAQGWKHAKATKLLLFSKFRATPPAVAALTSFGVEAHYRAQARGGYDGSWNRSRLDVTSASVMALFHPSPLLVFATDPLLGAGGSTTRARAAVVRQLRAKLRSLGVGVAAHKHRKRERQRPIWEIIAGLDARMGHRAVSREAWRAVSAAALPDAVLHWHSVQPPTEISGAEFTTLVRYAMGAPGVVLARAALRHVSDGSDPRHMEKLLKACWNGFRLYLDKSIFRACLPGRDFPDALLHAVVDGGLESVLDEHFWLRQGSVSGGLDALLQDLATTFRVGRGSFQFEQVGQARNLKKLRIRCHAAVPFGGTGGGKTRADEAGDDRADDLRTAFNSPFWPHVLATTSVGQEGLDFHSWCSRVGHWDLCSSPLDLEQREGRIQRFAGLSIRQELARREGLAAFVGVPSEHGSLWRLVAAAAAARHADTSGLAPWWVLPGARISRYIFGLGMGRDAARFDRLREARLLYRLALGQPSQEDFIDLLASSDPARLPLLRELCLDLSGLARSVKQGNLCE